ncbi:DUF3303 domain-containing protein [Alphaproteobacteria bacterium]|jgi:hypothetical protein|nr:DUF3303 domain-containing protein [Alphaproteobacteria bacterium]
MNFMVIEHFPSGGIQSIYERFRENGRMMPEGLEFVSSWVTADLSTCYQVMKADDVTLLQQWVAAWSDLAEFEILPVTSGSEVSKLF